jgi:hypothetical protein
LITHSLVLLYYTVDKREVSKEAREKKVQALINKPMLEVVEEKNERIQRMNDLRTITVYLQTVIKEYLAKEREYKGTLRNYIALHYQLLLQKYPEQIKHCFPFVYSGTKVKLYPKEFKAHFLGILRNHVEVRKGSYVRLTRAKVPVWIPSSKPSKVEDKLLTLARSATKSTNAKGRRATPGASLKEIEKFQIHPWNRKDKATKDKLKNIFFTYDDVENCTFKPKITPYAISGKAEKKEYEIDPESLAKEMGENFKDKYPYVFKSGVYNKALTFFQGGKYVEAMRKLKQGFNVDSLLRNFHPNYETYKK